MADDNLDIPQFLVIPQEIRNAAWDLRPPKSAPFVDPKLEADRARRAEQKKIETAARIVRMKASLAAKAQRPAKVDLTGMRWNTNRSRWEPDTQETSMNDQVQKYNDLATRLGLPALSIKKFESKAIGEQRIKKLQERVDGSAQVVQSASTESAQATATEAAGPANPEEPTVAKKAKSKKANGAKPKAAANGEVRGKKNQVVIDLLKRKSGATVDEARKATGWKDVHFSAHAKKAGIGLRKERNKEGVVRYWAD